MYKIRIPIGIALILLICGILYLDEQTNTAIGSSIIISGFILASLIEFYQMSKIATKFKRLSSYLVGLLLVCTIFSINLPQHVPANLINMLQCLSLFILFLFALYRNQEQDIIYKFSITLFGFIFIYFFLHHLLLIRGLGTVGLYYLILLIFVAKSMDIGGYLVGKALGKHKIAPSISPKKSWEGFWGGLTLCFITTYCLTSLFPSYIYLSWWQMIIFAPVTGILSFLGDLAESLIKRKFEVKDSGHILPEFGGFFDMIDSLLFVAPWGYYFFRFFLYF